MKKNKLVSVLFILCLLVAPMALAQSVKINWIEPSAESEETVDVEEVSEEPVEEELIEDEVVEEPVSEVDDSEGMSVIDVEEDMSIIDIEDAEENTPPVFYSIDSVTVNEGEEVSVELFGYDAEDDELIFSSDDLPEGAEIDDNIFTYTPDYDVVGLCWYGWLVRCRENIFIDFTVSDGVNEDSETLKLTIIDSDEKVVVEEVDEDEESIEDFIPDEEGMSVADEVSEEPIEEEVIEEPVEDETIDVIEEVEDVQEELLEEEPELNVSEEDSEIMETVEEEPEVEEDIIIIDEDLDIDEIVGDEDIVVEEVSEDDVSEDVVEEPVRSSAEAAVVKEGEELILELGVSDPDNDTLIFSVSDGIENGYFDGNEFHWVPPYTTVDKKSCWHYWILPCSENVPITFTVSDGEFDIEQDFIVKVIDKNSPPSINDIDDMVIGENEFINITPIAQDPDNDNIRFTFSEPLDRNGYWAPGEGNTGNFTFTITASDKKDIGTEDFTVTVLPVESKPVVESFYPEEEVVTLNEGENLTFNISASDADNDALSFVWKLNEQIGSIKDYMTLITNKDSEGEYFVNAEVSDPKNNTVSVVWKVVVENVNIPPTLADIEDISINEGEVVSIILDAYDEDGDSLKYSISEPVGNDGIWNTGYDDAGSYEVTVEVTDGVDTVEQVVNIEVDNVNLNAPVIDSFTPESSTLSLPAGESITFEIQASDNDNDDLEYEWVFNGEKVSESDSYVFNSEEDEEGSYDVQVIVSDGEETASMDWKLVVAIPNRPPILDLDYMVVDEGDLVNLSLPEKDIDGDYVFYTISEPFNSRGFWQTTLKDSGVYDIEVSASDKEFVVNKTFVLTVLDVNTPPEFEPIDDLTVKEGEPVEFEVVINDEDGDEVTLTLTGIPEGAEFEDSVFSWTPGFDTTSKGSEDFTIELEADDGSDAVEYEVKITVENVNHAPVIEPIDEITVNEGQEFTVTPEFYDEDGDELTVKFSGYMSSDTKKAAYGDAGSHLVTATVSDGIEEDSEGFVVTVVDVNQPPEFKEIAEEQDEVKIAIRVKSGTEAKDGSWIKRLFGW